MMGFGIFFMLLFWGLIIGGIAALVNWLTGRDQRPNLGSGAHHDTALETLQERYTRGEIARGAYDQMRRELET